MKGVGPDVRTVSFNSLFEMHNKSSGEAQELRCAFNSLFEMRPNWWSLWRQAPESPFNSLFEMRVKSGGGPAAAVGVLSILYLRCPPDFTLGIIIAAIVFQFSI